MSNEHASGIVMKKKGDSEAATHREEILMEVKETRNRPAIRCFVIMYELRAMHSILNSHLDTHDGKG